MFGTFGYGFIQNLSPWQQQRHCTKQSKSARIERSKIFCFLSARTFPTLHFRNFDWSPCRYRGNTKIRICPFFSKKLSNDIVYLKFLISVLKMFKILKFARNVKAYYTFVTVKFDRLKNRSRNFSVQIFFGNFWLVRVIMIVNLLESWNATTTTNRVYISNYKFAFRLKLCRRCSIYQRRSKRKGLKEATEAFKKYFR